MTIVIAIIIASIIVISLLTIRWSLSDRSLTSSWWVLASTSPERHLATTGPLKLLGMTLRINGWPVGPGLGRCNFQVVEDSAIHDSARCMAPSCSTSSPIRGWAPKAMDAWSRHLGVSTHAWAQQGIRHGAEHLSVTTSWLKFARKMPKVGNWLWDPYKK